MLHFGQNAVQPVVVLFERLTQHREPLFDLVDGGFGEPAGAPGSVDAADDEAGVFENFEVLGDGRLGHLEGLGEFGDGGLALSETGEDRAARGIGEGRECGVEPMHKSYLI